MMIEIEGIRQSGRQEKWESEAIWRVLICENAQDKDQGTTGKTRLTGKWPLKMVCVCLFVLTDTGSVPDLARLMIRDCRYDVSGLRFSG